MCPPTAEHEHEPAERHRSLHSSILGDHTGHKIARSVLSPLGARLPSDASANKHPVRPGASTPTQGARAIYAEARGSHRRQPVSPIASASRGRLQDPKLVAHLEVGGSSGTRARLFSRCARGIGHLGDQSRSRPPRPPLQPHLNQAFRRLKRHARRGLPHGPSVRFSRRASDCVSPGSRKAAVGDEASGIRRSGPPLRLWSICVGHTTRGVTRV